jgi:hypothetical protein
VNGPTSASPGAPPGRRSEPVTAPRAAMRTPTPASAPMIFISYRRDDSGGHVGRLYDSLAAKFGTKRLFFDIGSIGAGQDFVQVLQDAVARCAVLLVVIGKRWPGTTAQGTRRIDDPNDFVRLEVKSGLERDGVRVIPVLVHGGSMPTAEELPDDLKALVRRNAIELTDSRWKEDVGRLIAELDRVIATPIHIPTVDTLPSWSKWAAAAVFVVGFGFLAKNFLAHPVAPVAPSVATVPASAVVSAGIPVGDPSAPPTRIPSAAATALAQAKLWRSDAELTQIVIARPPGTAIQTPFTTKYTFRSPADGAGIAIPDAGKPEMLTDVSLTSIHAIPDGFVDLDVAIDSARHAGMIGALQSATLFTPTSASRPAQPTWKVTPIATAGARAYYIDAMTGQIVKAAVVAAKPKATTTTAPDNGGGFFHKFGKAFKDHAP